MRILKFFWSFPIEMIIFMFPQLNMDHTANKPRRRPLKTCGASAVEIVRKSCTRIQESDGVIGSTARMYVKFFGFIFPLLYSMLYTKWLAVSSFIDDYILTMEHLVEIVFPSSKWIFDKIDYVVYGAEALPDKFDDFCIYIPNILHQFCFLDWLCSHLVSRHIAQREKEIVVDVNHTEKAAADHDMQDEQEIAAFEEKSHSDNGAKDIHVEPCITNLSEVVLHKSLKRVHTFGSKRNSIDGFADSASCSSFMSAVSSPASDCSQEDHNNPFGKADATKFSYKDAVMNGNEKIDDGNVEEVLKSNNKDEKVLPNQLLELFEESWHLM